jgi:hypothetical protein
MNMILLGQCVNGCEDLNWALDKRMTGIFVGSTIHRDQLREAGFEAPIHVVSLPLHQE